MKNFKTKFLGLALVGLILGACSQMATYETADLMNEQAVANKAGFKLTPFGSGNANARTYSATDCGDFCIDPNDPEYSFQTATISNNSGPNTRVFTYTVNNTLTGFDLAWSYAASNNAGRKLRVTVSGAGFTSSQIYTSNKVQSAGNGSNSFTFDSSWNACDVVTVKAEILDGDNVLISGPNTTTYGLIGECGGCDEAEFSYETDNNRDIVFTYNHGEEVESLTLEFTFPQIMNLALNEDGKYEAPDGKIYNVNNPKNQTVFTWTGAVSCDSDDAETFEFSLTADCGKGKDGKANIWTDTKVTAINGVDLVDDELTTENEGPYSLKGNLENIVYTNCSGN